MAIKTLAEKFIHELGDIYDAEHKFLEAQQKMLGSANADAVITLLEQHIGETEEQIENLEQVYDLLEIKPKRIACDGAAGIISEGNKLLKEIEAVPALADLAIAGANSKVEHYEIACYLGLIASAQMMGEDDIVELLTQNLKQEQAAADKIETNMPALLEQAMANEAASSASTTA